MPPVIVYVTGFRQHAGKTVTSLGLAMLLADVMDPARIGYMKPVGQRTITLPNGTPVDEDALVIQMFSGIPDLDVEMMSPVRLESGFTKTFLESSDTGSETRRLEEKIMRSVKSLEGKDIIIAEGTGHPGVGAIVGLSNAHVGNLMGAQIVFLSGGGIGKALDMLEVDLSYFYHMGSRVRGIIFNRLIPEKIDSVKKYITEEMISARFPSVAGKLSILGFFPQVDALSNPTMKSLLSQFPGSTPLTDPEDAQWKSPCGGIRVVTSFERLTENDTLAGRPGNLVLVSSGSKKAILRVIAESGGFVAMGESPLCGIVVTDTGHLPLDEETRNAISESGIPAFAIFEDTARAEARILATFENTKLQVFDRVKAGQIRELFREHFDMNRFVEAFGIKV